MSPLRFPDQIIDGVLCHVVGELQPAFTVGQEWDLYAIPATAPACNPAYAFYTKGVPEGLAQESVPWEAFEEVMC